MTTHIPRRFEDITPATLTALLGGSEVPHAVVQSVAVEPIGRGVGFLGQRARLRLTYDRSDATPRTPIAKLPTVEPGGREICRLFRFYEREIRFYRELAREVPVRVPRCYGMDWVPMADAPVHQSAEPAYQKALVPFLKTFGDFLSPKLRDLTERLSTHVIDLLRTRSTRR